MWYVMQVFTGEEENVKIQCERMIPTHILESCFLPYYEEKRKIRGVWRVQRRRLFPGYLFMVTEQVDELRRNLYTVIGMTKMIGVGKEIIPLTEKEIDLIQRLSGKKHVVAMSEGIILGTKIMVTEGPLMGLEGFITKVDRHKRRAYLSMEMFGRKMEVQVGLEIVRKM